jgi:hypothetical protein
VARELDPLVMSPPDFETGQQRVCEAGVLKTRGTSVRPHSAIEYNLPIDIYNPAGAVSQ